MPVVKKIQVVDEATRIRAKQAYLSRAFLDWLHDDLWSAVKDGTHPKTNGVPTTMEEWGKELAKLIGRPKPFRKSQLSKFIAGISTPLDIAEAMAKYFELPMFAIAADSIEEVEWFLAGQALRRSDPDDFRKLLRNAQARTRLNREISQPGEASPESKKKIPKQGKVIRFNPDRTKS